MVWGEVKRITIINSSTKNPYRSLPSQQSQILVIGWDSTHKNEHLFNVYVIAMLHEGNNYTTCKLKQKGVNIKLIIVSLGVMKFILWVPL